MLVPPAGVVTTRLEHVRAAVIAAGYTPATAAGLVAWLVAGGGTGGGVSVATRTRYRAIVRQLVEAGSIDT